MSFSHQPTALACLLVAILCFQPAQANTETLNLRLPFNSAPPLPANLIRSAQSAPVLAVNEPRAVSLSLNSTSALQLYLLNTTFDPPRRIARWWSELQRDWQLETRSVRLCWPASHPTDFDLQVYTSPDSSQVPPPLYLAISASPSFVAFPSAEISSPFVPFTLLLEPAHLGGVPESTLPLIGSLLSLLLLLWLTKLPSRVADAFEGLGRAKRRRERSIKVE
ncbi:hypothetical protein BCR35DRAFT_310697 [Leucosporidium creatinivorum]|uniref:Uncharacterized protein n=1 Tax=Leucosporidium creatinivorum TaxID=106004 RepID=A0A1Y2CXZ5_9BASI|nr:hypothetical protein BCR35DRAFT_310697 [Leucosporidium creatinivorum]